MKYYFFTLFMVLAMPVWACERLTDGTWLVPLRETLKNCDGYKRGDTFKVIIDMSHDVKFPPDKNGKCREDNEIWAYASDGMCHSHRR